MISDDWSETILVYIDTRKVNEVFSSVRMRVCSRRAVLAPLEIVASGKEHQWNIYSKFGIFWEDFIGDITASHEWCISTFQIFSFNLVSLKQNEFIFFLLRLEKKNILCLFETNTNLKFILGVNFFFVRRKYKLHPP